MNDRLRILDLVSRARDRTRDVITDIYDGWEPEDIPYSTFVDAAARVTDIWEDLIHAELVPRITEAAGAARVQTVPPAPAVSLPEGVH